MNYYEYKLDVDDVYQCQQLIDMIQKLRIQVNKEADEIEKLINLKIQECFKLRDQYKLEQYEQIFNNHDLITFENQFNNLTKQSLNILFTTNNKLEYIKTDHFKFLNIQPAIMKLKEIIQQLSFNFDIAKRMILGKNPINNVNIAIKEIWKHQTIAKNGDKFKTFTFKKNQGFAEVFLCKSSFELNGIYHAQLFTGINNEGKQFDCQKDIHYLQFSIHEGLDLSSYYYRQELELNHQKLTQKDQLYQIMLNQSILLKKGVIYTISLIPINNQNFSTYMFTGKQGESQQCLKFLDKQIDLIDQTIIAQQQSNQSPIPGFMINI
ncbi:unnamed protein product [Paramecium pentaurelia]|uniref:Uncharacterized protein n=1 Tax=Paramecium pentaurelia TaxID=43138 RepID=A0A8S1UYH7_9CILI|nr:unnamed protein product [Paramecium pentaurelia]